MRVSSKREQSEGASLYEMPPATTTCTTCDLGLARNSPGTPLSGQCVRVPNKHRVRSISDEFRGSSGVCIAMLTASLRMPVAVFRDMRCTDTKTFRVRLDADTQHFQASGAVFQRSKGMF